MTTYNVAGAEFMGDNVRASLKSVGSGVRIMPLAKICVPHMVELGDDCRVCDFVFIWGGRGVKIGKNCDIQPHVTVWEEAVWRLEIGFQLAWAACC